MIDLNNVSKKYGDNIIFDNVTTRFESGKIHGIMGRNGTGKTVLLRMIIGLEHPDVGEILVNGQSIGHDIEFARDVGFIIETPRFLPDFTAMENLLFLSRLNKKIGPATVRTVMENVGLDPDCSKKVGKFSLGMRQRLGIAQAIMEDPNTVILDEPTNALDTTGVKMLFGILRSYAKQGKTVILVSHIQADMYEFCDELYDIEDGGILKHQKGDA